MSGNRLGTSYEIEATKLGGKDFGDFADEYLPTKHNIKTYDDLDDDDIYYNLVDDYKNYANEFVSQSKARAEAERYHDKQAKWDNIWNTTDAIGTAIIRNVPAGDLLLHKAVGTDRHNQILQQRAQLPETSVLRLL